MEREEKPPIDNSGFIQVDPPELPPDPNEGDFSIGGNVSFGSKLDVSGDVSFYSDLYVFGDVSFDSDLIVNGNIGIGTTQPQQRLDVAGSIKIDENIYDSANTPARNGYFLSRDERGIRWIPLIVEPRTDNGIGTIIGIRTDGIFVLDEGNPLYPE